jgi:hypothetical protein
MAANARKTNARNLFFITGEFGVKTFFAVNYFTNIRFISIYGQILMRSSKGTPIENERFMSEVISAYEDSRRIRLCPSSSNQEETDVFNGEWYIRKVETVAM